ncbi:unnamed protein product [marine sediment metagenome]|uniref:Uncharacterized protein n=1 Tax=marine sediment metagenome TaxID=412755 RepID=X1LFV6_9ZZZZ
MIDRIKRLQQMLGLNLAVKAKKGHADGQNLHKIRIYFLEF